MARDTTRPDPERCHTMRPPFSTLVRFVSAQSGGGAFPNPNCGRPQTTSCRGKHFVLTFRVSAWSSRKILGRVPLCLERDLSSRGLRFFLVTSFRTTLRGRSARSRFVRALVRQLGFDLHLLSSKAKSLALAVRTLRGIRGGHFLLPAVPKGFEATTVLLFEVVGRSRAERVLEAVQVGEDFSTFHVAIRSHDRAGFIQLRARDCSVKAIVLNLKAEIHSGMPKA